MQLSLASQSQLPAALLGDSQAWVVVKAALGVPVGLEGCFSEPGGMGADLGILLKQNSVLQGRTDVRPETTFLS